MSGESHVTVKIPKDLVEEMDKLIGKHGFRSRGEITKEAIRRFMEHYSDVFEAPTLSHFNMDEYGVQVAEIQANRIIRVAHVHFTPKGVRCEEDDSDECKHVDFALRLPDAQEILRKKGWKPK